MGWHMKDKGFIGSAKRNAGNAITMIFMAIGMAGVVTYGLNNIVRGPAVTAAEASRKTIAENNLVATTRLAITGAASQQNNGGDCDGDGFVEPLPFRSAGAGQHPTGGGYLPMTLGASMTDPWGNQYGYCVWDPGTVSQSDNAAGCGNATGTANRLEGAPRDDQPAIAVISAGKNGTFQTTCNAYVDALTLPATPTPDGKPDTPLVVEPTGSDDIVLTYTYAEANGIGGGLWKLREADPNIAEIGMNIESTSAGGATFHERVELRNKGLVLPGDPGDDTVTGPCDEAKDGQLRRNVSTSPPTVEMCDFAGSSAWVQIAGAQTPAQPFNPSAGNCTANEGGPFFKVAELDISNDGLQSIWTGIGQDTQTIFVSTGNNGVRALSFDGSQFVLGGSFGAGTTNWSSVWHDGTYLYASSRWSNQRLVALSYNGTAFTQLGVQNLSGSNMHNIWGDGTTLFVGLASMPGTINAYGFDGTTFTLKGSQVSYEPTAIWGNGGNIYAVHPSTRSQAMRWNGTAFSNDVEHSTALGSGGVWADANYMYTVGNTTGIVAYTYDGTTLALVEQDFNSGVNHGRIWGDGVYLYATTNTGVRAYRFDGTEFTLVAEDNTLGDSEAVWGDGNYIYVSGIDGRIHAFGGFACTSPNPSGGSAPPTPASPAARPAHLPDPLDVGLVAHWKMDEPQGTTDVLDSVGENHGSLAWWATRTMGQKNGAVSLWGVLDNDNIMIPGLLGEPAAGTIAGWVNSGEVEYDASGIDQSMIMTIGDRVNLYEYYDNQAQASTTGLVLEYQDGSTRHKVYSNYQLQGTGWHYVVATFDNTNDLFSIYVDGVMQGQVENTANITYGGGTNTYFGRNQSGESDWNFNGSLDDFRVYDRALSPVEVKALSERELNTAVQSKTLVSPLSVAAKMGKVSAAADYACAIKDDGSLWCWGRDWPSQALGNGDDRNTKYQPVSVKEPTSQVFYLSGTNSASTGPGTAFNKRFYPYLQNLQTAVTSIPANTAVQGHGFTEANSIGFIGAMGKRHYSVRLKSSAAMACVTPTVTLTRLASNGTVITSGTLTDRVGTTLATEVVLSGDIDFGTFGASDVFRVDYTLTNTCGSASGAFNLYSELETPPIVQTPWVSVSTSFEHACGLKGDGSAWCWGMDGSYQLGNSGYASGLYPSPSRVVDTGLPWTSIVTGGENTCGIQEDGSLWCWGLDTDGQAGNGAITGLRPDPFRVGTDTDWVGVTIGSNFACGTKSSGLAYCWGDDTYGQLGNGTGVNTDQPSPYLVSDPGPWLKLSAGSQHVCGIKKDSTLWCWGRNSYYGLGNKLGDRYTPYRVIPYYDGWLDVSVGDMYTCGIRNDGGTYCWGGNTPGRLGHNAGANTYIPQKVLGLSETATVSAGFTHTCAMKTNGSVLCWGADNYGQLGNGSYTQSTVAYPVNVAGFPSVPGWSWDRATDIISAPYNYNIGLSGSFIGDVAMPMRGFGFTAPGKAKIYHETNSVQFAIESGAAGAAQLSFKNTPIMGAVDVTSGLVARWLFDETSGTTASTSVGSHPATLVNGPQWDKRGKINGSAAFDGDNDYMHVANHANLRPAGIFTISLWVLRAPNQQTTGLDTLITKAYQHEASTPAVSYSIDIDNATGNALFRTGHTSGALDTLTSAAPIPVGQWTHIVASFDRTGSAHRKRLYINGVESSYTNLTTNMQYDSGTTTGRLYFGTGYPGDSDSFAGSLDDVRFYSRQITDNEAFQIYAVGLNNNVRVRGVGIDFTNNHFEIARNGTTSPVGLDTVTADINLSGDGMMGVGKSGVPVARVDVNGAVRFGTDTICDSNRTGAMRYTGGTPPWSYCNGTAWTSFGGSTTWKLGRPNAPATSGYFTDQEGSQGCAIAASGAAYCWGKNDQGQVGNNTAGATDVAIPTMVHSDSSSSGWTDWVQIETSIGFTCGLRANGTVWCWGDGDGSRLGRDQDTVDSARPVQVHTDTGPGSWSDWKQIAIAGDAACGLRTNGQLWCWGGSAFGRLGIGSDYGTGRPTLVQTDTGPGGWSDWTFVAGQMHGFCGIRADGSAWCWGYNTRYNGGHNTNEDDVLRPTRVHTDSSPAGWFDWVSLSIGEYNSCGVRANGTAWCWGESGGGRLGNGTSWVAAPRPVQVLSDTAGAGWTDWIQLAVGRSVVCGLRANGTLWCWGDNIFGEIGVGNNTTSYPSPVQVQTDTGPGSWSDWVSVKAGYHNMCGTRTNGAAYCWGMGKDLALGNGSGTDRTRPTLITTP